MDFPNRFRTRRLMLTRIGHADVGDIDRLRTDIRLAPALGSMRTQDAAALVEELIADWERHSYGLWVARDPHSGHFLGCGGARPTQADAVPDAELTCALRPEFRRRGFATELARVAVAQGFVRAGLREIVGFTPPGNDASRRLMEKTGLAYECDVMHAGQRCALFRLRVETWRNAPLMPFMPSSPPVELATA